jgi:malate synthase
VIRATFIQNAGLDERSRSEILSQDALAFLAELHGRFGPRRQELLAARRQRHAALRGGGTLDFLPETREIRDGDWRVAAPRADYADRRVEITGPTDRKLIINALNSGARGFMADFEDANSPTWRNQVTGHANLIDAIERTITYESSEGRQYTLRDDVGTLLMRPRGWHLDETHLTFDDLPAAGALVDFGLYAFHAARRLLERGSAPYLYLPKMEHHQEARLWNDIFVWTQDALGVSQGSFRATVLIETLPAAFQMDEILYELRDHSYGLHAGRWDYIFSLIKSFRDRPEFLLPDRSDVKMTVPFMASYARLLAATCHRRGAFAMGGMSALIPSRTDPEANRRAIDAVREDKQREATMGFDGTWVAHPDVVEVAQAPFDAVLGDRPNQIGRQLEVGQVSAADLLDATVPGGSITEAGLATNISVAFQYVSFWLGGRGAVGISNLMEDAATAEISRTQIWQWIRHKATLDNGLTVTHDLVRSLLDDEMARIHAEVGDEVWERGRPEDTRALFELVSLADELPEFLTILAYELLD